MTSMVPAGGRRGTTGMLTAITLSGRNVSKLLRRRASVSVWLGSGAIPWPVVPCIVSHFDGWHGVIQLPAVILLYDISPLLPVIVTGTSAGQPSFFSALLRNMNRGVSGTSPADLRYQQQTGGRMPGYDSAMRLICITRATEKRLGLFMRYKAAKMDRGQWWRR